MASKHRFRFVFRSLAQASLQAAWASLALLFGAHTVYSSAARNLESSMQAHTIAIVAIFLTLLLVYFCIFRGRPK